MRTRKPRRAGRQGAPRAVEYGALLLAATVVAVTLAVALGHYVLVALQSR